MLKEAGETILLSCPFSKIGENEMREYKESPIPLQEQSGHLLCDEEIKDFVDEKFLKSISDYAAQTVLRRVLFDETRNRIDWQDFYMQIKEQMPELIAKETDEPEKEEELDERC